MELIQFALLAVLIGMRHGIDGDHVAAIADMVGSEKRRKRQVSLGVMYALGHGFIVLVVGLLAIYIGVEMSNAMRSTMEVLVGITLIVLGGFILYSLIRQRKEYEYKSRLQMIYEGVMRVTSKAKPGEKRLSSMQLGLLGACMIGVIHGIGVESPTQIALLTNAAGMDNVSAGAMQLCLFVLGLFISTTCITLCLSWGFIKAQFRKTLYMILGSITGAYSVWLGASMLLALWKGGA